MSKILKIQNNNWLQSEDGKWYNLSLTNDGKVYLDGQLVRDDGLKIVVKEIFDPIENRFEILDL